MCDFFVLFSMNMCFGLVFLSIGVFAFFFFFLKFFSLNWKCVKMYVFIILPLSMKCKVHCLNVMNVPTICFAC